MSQAFKRGRNDTNRRAPKLYHCPFRHAHRVDEDGLKSKEAGTCEQFRRTHLDGTLQEVDEIGPFENFTTIKDFRNHLDVCPYEAEEVAQLATQQAMFYSKHPQLAQEAATIIRNAIDRLRANDLDEVVERVEGHRKVAVRGLLTSTMREQLGWAAGMELSDADSVWVDFSTQCLGDFVAPCVPCRYGEEFPIEVLRIAKLRDDLRCEDVVAGEHSYRVWEKALASAAKMSAAPDGSAKIREGLGISEPQETAEHQVMQVFRKADVDGNGSISMLELSTVLRALDSNMDYNKLNSIFDAVDVNHNGSIEYEEFIAWLFC